MYACVHVRCDGAGICHVSRTPYLAPVDSGAHNKRMLASVPSTILQMFDSNKDGSLSRDEFTQAVQYFCGLDQEERQYDCKCTLLKKLPRPCAFAEARHGLHARGAMRVIQGCAYGPVQTHCAGCAVR